MRPFATALALGACLTLAPFTEAHSGWFGASQTFKQSPTVLKIKNDKQQQEKNKACGPGKVFVKNEGCVKREKAEKAKAKEKEEKAKEKAKQTPPPPPPPVKSDCRDYGPNEGSAGSAADPKMKYECEPLGGGKKRCCWVKYP